MASYVPINTSRAGVRIDNAGVPVALSDDFPNDGNSILIVENADAAEIDVTFDLAIDPNASEPTQSTVETVLPVPAGESEVFGPFPKGTFGDPVTVNYSAIANVTAYVLRVVRS